MKKHISLILTGLLIAVVVHAQDPETLTNSSVIKMSKANLSEELIIDMIRSSPAGYDLSDEAQRTLAGEGISRAVIQAMKSASETKVPVSEKSASVQEKKATPVAAVETGRDVIQPESAYVPSVTEETVTIEALNYVAPLTELVKFNENEFKSMELAIAEWDKQVRSLVSDVNKVKGQMLQVENEMRQKKNADTKSFSADILSLKKKLDVYRKNYQQSKDIMVGGGQKILKNLEGAMSDRIRNIGKAYSEAGQKITSSSTNPASGVDTVTINWAKKAVSDNAAGYIVYSTEMPAWYQNEIIGLNALINTWNPRVRKIVDDDIILKNKLDPIEKRLEDLKSNAKQNKNEISTLKKQSSEIEKDRKQLADQMKDNAKELSSYLKQLSQKNEDSLKERFTDIIENITYSFQEKLSL